MWDDTQTPNAGPLSRLLGEYKRKEPFEAELSGRERVALMEITVQITRATILGVSSRDRVIWVFA